MDSDIIVRQQRITNEFVLVNLLFLYLLMTMTIRFYENKYNAKTKYFKLALSLKVKFLLIFLSILTYIAMIVASFLNQVFWIQGYEFCSLFYCFPIIVLILQIRMLKFEYSMQLPFSWYQHQLFWTSCLFVHSTFLGETIMIWKKCDIDDIKFDIIRTLISLCLTIHGYNNNQDHPQIRNSLTAPLTNVLRENRFQRSQSGYIKAVKKKEIIIHIKKVKYIFDIEKNKEIPVFQIKINVFEKKSQILKSLDQFYQLQQEILNQLPQQNDELSNYNLPKIDFLRIGQDKILELENFLNYFLDNEHLITNAFVNFFDLSPKISEQLFRKSPYLIKHEVQLQTVSSLQSEIESNCNIYFDIKYQGYTHHLDQPTFFQFDITLKQFSQNFYRISKRFSDFQSLQHEMSAELKKNNVRLPYLSQKYVLFEKKESKLKKRGINLEKFLQTILNEKVYFYKCVFDFIELEENDRKFVQQISNPFRFNTFKAKIIQIFTLYGNDQKPFSQYQFQITEYKDQFLSSIKNQYNILKRFNQFESLHNSLQLRFQKLPKFHFNFEILTFDPSEKRRFALEKYLNDLFLIKGIEDSYAFKQFIKIFENEGNFSASQEESVIDEFNDHHENLDIQEIIDLKKSTDHINNSLQEDPFGPNKLVQ